MILNKTVLTMLAGTAALCCSVATIAQDAGSSAATDKTFVMMADEGNSTEIAASKLALKKSKNPEVKQYAQQMITDHMKLRTDMAPFAEKMSIPTPQPLNETHQAEAKRLMALSGKDFDMEYVKAMDQDHHKTLGMFQNEIATTSNADLKTAVQQGVTVIQAHTQMADDMATKMNIPVAATPGQ
jgi:putative membrane protein